MFCPIRKINHGIIRPMVKVTMVFLLFFWQTDYQLYNQSFTTNTMVNYKLKTIVNLWLPWFKYSNHVNFRCVVVCLSSL